MSTLKKNNFITQDLDFCELQLESWKKYIEDNPYDKVEDRKEMQKSKTGGSFYAVVQTKEAIQKALRDTSKDYIALLSTVKQLREIEEEKKKAVKGGGDRPTRMS